MRRHVRRIAILTFGWIFIVLGVLGLFLPFLQGILFLVIGTVLLAEESPLVQRWLHRLRERYPAFDRAVENAHAWLRRRRRRRNQAEDG